VERLGGLIESGVPQQTVDAIRERKPLDALTAEDKLVLDFCSQLAGGSHHVSDATFNAAREHFGVQALVELVGTLGYFAMIAFPLNAFQMEMSAAQIAKRKPFVPLRYDPQLTDVMNALPPGAPQFTSAAQHGAPRLPLVREHDDLPSLHQHFFDRIVRVRGRVDTPYQVLLNSPDMAERIAYVANYFLYESPLDPASRALTWLITAREFDCGYAWKAALGLARKADIEQALINSIYQRTLPSSLPPERRIVSACCYQLLRGNHHIDDATYQAAVERCGLSSVVQIAATLGYVAMMSIITNAFELNASDDTAELVL
jgi:4-carboxymuconolactone decarboxylase